jgi:hypothetical protein
VEACTREINGSAYQTAEREVNQTYDEEGFHCHRTTSFELEPSRTKYKRKTEKEMVLNT